MEGEKKRKREGKNEAHGEERGGEKRRKKEEIEKLFTEKEMEEELVQRIVSGDYDKVIQALENRKRQLLWKRLPRRIILLRHGESEGNINRQIYTSKGDSMIELTKTGRDQAKQAGQRLASLVNDSDGRKYQTRKHQMQQMRFFCFLHNHPVFQSILFFQTGKIFVAVSPFERTVQTLCGLYLGGFPKGRVGEIHHDPRIREQEFGNFQNPGLTATVRAEEKMVGRFYYRRPNAESSADVFDRVSSFWESLLSHGSASSLLLQQDSTYDACLLVTHGLTIRLLLMAMFRWSVSTFETVYNIGNCHHITLRKNSVKCCYDLCTSESYPPEVLWASRPVWVRLKDLTPSEDVLKRLERLKAFRCILRQSEGKQEDHISRKLSRAPSKAEIEILDTEEEEEEWDLQLVSNAIDELESIAFRQCSRPFTVIDYMKLDPPRTAKVAEAVQNMVPGHELKGSPDELRELAKTTAIPLENVLYIDWWGEKVCHRSRQMYSKISSYQSTNERVAFVHTLPISQSLSGTFQSSGEDESEKTRPHLSNPFLGSNESSPISPNLPVDFDLSQYT